MGLSAFLPELMLWVTKLQVGGGGPYCYLEVEAPCCWWEAPEGTIVELWVEGDPGVSGCSLFSTTSTGNHEGSGSTERVYVLVDMTLRGAELKVWLLYN